MSAKFEEGAGVSIDGIQISYDEENEEYEIEITDATLVCLDLKSKLMRIKIHSNKIKSCTDSDDGHIAIANKMLQTQNIDEEPSDDTDQEQEEEEEEDVNTSNMPNTTNDLNVYDDKKEDINDIIPHQQLKQQQDIICNDNDNESESDQTQHSEPFIPNDEDEIIQLSNDENDVAIDDEESKKQDHHYDDLVIPVIPSSDITILENIDINETEFEIIDNIQDIPAENKETNSNMEIFPSIIAMRREQSGTPNRNENGVDEYASSDENDRFFKQCSIENKKSIKIEHNLRDPYLDEILTKQINAALKLDESEQEARNAEEYGSNEEELIKHERAQKNNWRWALKAENIASEWWKYAPTINLQNISAMTKSLTKITTSSLTTFVNIAAGTFNKIGCNLSIDDCDCVQRLIFIMKYYSFWMKFKIETETDTDNAGRYEEYPYCVTKLIDSLKAYNRHKLLRDYLHIRHYHFNDDKLIAYIHRSQIPDCNDKNRMCKCITRNHQNQEIYKSLTDLERRKLYWINSTLIKDGSEEEIFEINLQKLLDVIHSSFLHNAISNGTKFVTFINIGQEEEEMAAAAADRQRQHNIGNQTVIIDAPHYEFGIKVDFYNKQKRNYCQAKYADLKHELLNNSIHCLCVNDFFCIYNMAQEYMLCDEGCKSMIRKREIDCNISKQRRMNIENVIVLLTRCNYSSIERKFNTNSWMKKNRKDNNKQELLAKMCEIATWNKLLHESVMLFGDLLTDSQYIYHGLNYKMTFKDISCIQFNICISCTSQYSVAKNFANEFVSGICLKLGRMQLTKDKNYMFPLSDFSAYPNEREVLIFGDKLSFIDIVYDSLSHHDYVLSLKLYDKIIRGRWFTRNNDYHQKKHQRRIVKMIENMMEDKNHHSHVSSSDDGGNGMVKIDLDLGLGLNYIDPYIQSLFETMTKNVIKKTIWINKECDTLLPELKTVFLNDFLPFLKKKPFNIQSKYAHVDTFIVDKKHLFMTARTNPLKSKPFDHVEIYNNDDMDMDVALDMNVNNDVTINKPMSLKQFKQLKQSKEKENINKNKPRDLKITFGFRCYKKYDHIKKQDMFKGEFIVVSLPETIESVRMLGGLWIESIPLCKWDWCSFSSKKTSKGSSLFSLNQLHLNDDQQLKIKICYQVKEVIQIQKVSLP